MHMKKQQELVLAEAINGNEVNNVSLLILCLHVFNIKRLLFIIALYIFYSILYYLFLIFLKDI